MALVTNFWLYDLILVLLAIIIAVYVHYSRAFKYWEKRGVRTSGPASIPFGHMKGMKSTKHVGEIVADIYNSVKDEKVVGAYAFGIPVIVVRDLDVAKDIMIKEFTNFHDRGLEMYTEQEPLNGHLFFLTGQKWRNLRVKLTPTFTTGRIRMMFATALGVARELEEVLDDCVQLPEIDIKDILARYTTDVIASCAFGLEANSLKNPDSLFRVMGREISKKTWKAVLSDMALFFMPSIAKYLPLRMTPKHVEDFFIGLVRDTMKYREDNMVQRKDFLQLLLQLKNMGYVQDVDNPGEDIRRQENTQKFTVEEAAAQAFIFYLGGYETSHLTMLWTLYELALNPELQAKVRCEINDIKIKHGGALTYDALHEMNLLDRIFAETLRKYPVANLLLRQCENEYKVPGTDIILPPKTQVWFPLQGYHHDEEYFPNPGKFDPDRFLPEEKAKRHPFAYLPFGDGPRNCIGNRFGMLSTKAGLATILSRFIISPSKSTPIPCTFDPMADFLAPKEMMKLKISLRS